MTAKCYRIGVLLSDSGPYGTVSRSMRNGAMLAFEEIKRSGTLNVRLEPIVANPAGETARYAELSAALLGQGIRHVVGCYTSSSRKDVIPHFEKHDALLWYPSHYAWAQTTSGHGRTTGFSEKASRLPEGRSWENVTWRLARRITKR